LGNSNTPRDFGVSVADLDLAVSFAVIDAVTLTATKASDDSLAGEGGSFFSH